MSAPLATSILKSSNLYLDFPFLQNNIVNIDHWVHFLLGACCDLGWVLERISISFLPTAIMKAFSEIMAICTCGHVAMERFVILIKYFHL